MSELGEYTGNVITDRINVGSSSEMDGYQIITEDGQRVPVVIRSEDPFEQPTLKGLLGRRCRVKGEFKWDKFVVAFIKPA